MSLTLVSEMLRTEIKKLATHQQQYEKQLKHLQQMQSSDGLFYSSPSSPVVTGQLKSRSQEESVSYVLPPLPSIAPESPSTPGPRSRALSLLQLSLCPERNSNSNSDKNCVFSGPSLTRNTSGHSLKDNSVYGSNPHTPDIPCMNLFANLQSSLQQLSLLVEMGLILGKITSNLSVLTDGTYESISCDILSTYEKVRGLTNRMGRNQNITWQVNAKGLNTGKHFCYPDVLMFVIISVISQLLPHSECIKVKGYFVSVEECSRTNNYAQNDLFTAINSVAEINSCGMVNGNVGVLVTEVEAMGDPMNLSEIVSKLGKLPSDSDQGSTTRTSSEDSSSDDARSNSNSSSRGPSQHNSGRGYTVYANSESCNSNSNSRQSSKDLHDICDAGTCPPLAQTEPEPEVELFGGTLYAIGTLLENILGGSSSIVTDNGCTFSFSIPCRIETEAIVHEESKLTSANLSEVGVAVPLETPTIGVDFLPRSSSSASDNNCSSNSGDGKNSNEIQKHHLHGRTRTLTHDENQCPNAKPRALQVLLVDDSITVLKILSIWLTKNNCVVTKALNGFQALELMKVNAYDLVLLDFLMPIMDGLTCLRMFQEFLTSLADIKSDFLEQLSHQWIIGLSATALPEDQQVAFEAGMHLFCTKPVDMQGLKIILEAKRMRMDFATVAHLSIHNRNISNQDDQHTIPLPETASIVTTTFREEELKNLFRSFHINPSFLN
jgi:CheY-like chemotaxis protein